MRLLLINPNTSAHITERMLNAARAVLGPDVHVSGATASFGPAVIGTRSEAISKRLRPIASDWLRSSAPMPGYAPGVSIRQITGMWNFAAMCILAMALR